MNTQKVLNIRISRPALIRLLISGVFLVVGFLAVRAYLGQPNRNPINTDLGALVDCEYNGTITTTKKSSCIELGGKEVLASETIAVEETKPAPIITETRSEKPPVIEKEETFEEMAKREGYFEVDIPRDSQAVWCKSSIFADITKNIIRYDRLEKECDEYEDKAKECEVSKDYSSCDTEFFDKWQAAAEEGEDLFKEIKSLAQNYCIIPND